jgi:hypothetical protein
MSGAPLWRRGFDALERPLGNVLADVARSGPFADGLALTLRLQRRLQREVERRTRRVLHLANLPAATDVRRLSQQLAQLQRQVRALSHMRDGRAADSTTTTPPRRAAARR